MLKVDPTIQTLTVAGIVAVVLSALVNANMLSHVPGEAHAATSTPQTAATPDVKKGSRTWAASATGRVEPKGGEIRILAQSPGEITQVIAKVNDKVEAGDLLVVLDEEDLGAKLAAALAEEAVRVRERNEEAPEGAPDGPAASRRKAEDAVAAAERAVFAAQRAFDEMSRRIGAGDAGATDLSGPRTKLQDARKRLAEERAALDRVNAMDGMPLPTRLESSLTLARADVAQIEQAIERKRVRAPADGTVLNIWAREGEFAITSPDAPLVLFGDISSLRVRTEVEERDVVKVKVGQRAIIKADAFGDQEFAGVVTSMAPALGAPRILTRGPRRPNDVEVLEVMVTLDGDVPLLTGMRVDVFFEADDSAS
jgi:HlyD family secretion protein